MKKIIALFLIAIACMGGVSQTNSLRYGDIIGSAQIGTPHLTKGVVKLAVKTANFQSVFNSYVEVSNVTGFNPVSLRGEVGLNEFFGLGLNYSFWNIRFDVRDYYNAQNQNFGAVVKDSVDVYSFNVISRSFGIRPNLHIPMENNKNDFYFGLGLGITSNKVAVSFTSTDVGRAAKIFRKDLEKKLSLPGSIYFAPTIGYRRYFGNYIGTNVEFGYEKGALLLVGFQFRLNWIHLIDKDKEK
jgi:hypothetical protein